MCCSEAELMHDPRNEESLLTLHVRRLLKMGGIGFEPMTSTTSRWHSPAELTARMLDYPTPKKI